MYGDLDEGNYYSYYAADMFGRAGLVFLSGGNVSVTEQARYNNWGYDDDGIMAFGGGGGVRFQEDFAAVIILSKKQEKKFPG